MPDFVDSPRHGSPYTLEGVDGGELGRGEKARGVVGGRTVFGRKNEIIKVENKI